MNYVFRPGQKTNPLFGNVKQTQTTQGIDLDQVSQNSLGTFLDQSHSTKVILFDKRSQLTMLFFICFSFFDNSKNDFVVCKLHASHGTH